MREQLLWVVCDHTDSGKCDAQFESDGFIAPDSEVTWDMLRIGRTRRGLDRQRREAPMSITQRPRAVRMTPGELTRAGRDVKDARQRLDTAMHRAADAAEKATHAGMTEVEIARHLGVNRLTVRKWLGK